MKKLNGLRSKILNFAMGHCKGQGLSIDLMFSVSLFILLVLIIIWTMVYVTGKVNEQRNELWNYQRTIDLSDRLFDTTGEPVEWNITNVSSIGLSENYAASSINWNKLIYLNNTYTLNKTDILMLTGLKNDEDLFIRIGDITIGNMSGWDEDEYDIIKVIRIKKMNGSVVICELYTKLRR